VNLERNWGVNQGNPPAKGTMSFAARRFFYWAGLWFIIVDQISLFPFPKTIKEVNSQDKPASNFIHNRPFQILWRRNKHEA
jgi:hypothetical protein